MTNKQYNEGGGMIEIGVIMAVAALLAGLIGCKTAPKVDTLPDDVALELEKDIGKNMDAKIDAEPVKLPAGYEGVPGTLVDVIRREDGIVDVYDGCNTCSCKDSVCLCTVLWCSREDVDAIQKKMGEGDIVFNEDGVEIDHREEEPPVYGGEGFRLPPDEAELCEEPRCTCKGGICCGEELCGE